MAIISQNVKKHDFFGFFEQNSPKTCELLTTFYAKQTQFRKKSNALKVRYIKGLREKYHTGHLVKTDSI